MQASRSLAAVMLMMAIACGTEGHVVAPGQSDPPPLHRQSAHFDETPELIVPLATARRQALRDACAAWLGRTPAPGWTRRSPRLPDAEAPVIGVLVTLDDGCDAEAIVLAPYVGGRYDPNRAAHYYLKRDMPPSGGPVGYSPLLTLP